MVSFHRPSRWKFTISPQNLSEKYCWRYYDPCIPPLARNPPVKGGKCLLRGGFNLNKRRPFSLSVESSAADWPWTKPPCFGLPVQVDKFRGSITLFTSSWNTLLCCHWLPSATNSKFDASGVSPTFCSLICHYLYNQQLYRKARWLETLFDYGIYSVIMGSFFMWPHTTHLQVAYNKVGGSLWLRGPSQPICEGTPMRCCSLKAGILCQKISCKNEEAIQFRDSF